VAVEEGVGDGVAVGGAVVAVGVAAAVLVEVGEAVAVSVGVMVSRVGYTTTGRGGGVGDGVFGGDLVMTTVHPHTHSERAKPSTVPLITGSLPFGWSQYCL